MTNEEFLAAFEPLVGAPDGIKRLRGIILNLAVDGLLGGETLSPSLSRTLNLSEWTSAPLGDLVETVRSGFACSQKHLETDGYPHLRTMNIGVDGEIDLGVVKRISREKVDVRKAQVLEGEVLFNNTNSVELVGKSALVRRDMEAAFSNHITVIRTGPEIDSAFLRWVLVQRRQSGHFAAICNRWIGQAGVSQKALLREDIHFPSVPEQERIVERVDELMALCDELEAEQAHAESLRTATAKSAFSVLVESALTDPTRAQRVLGEHFDAVLEPGSNAVKMVGELRKTILDLAVAGAFTCGLNNRSSVLSKQHWSHLRLGDVVEVVRGITFPGHAKSSAPRSGLVGCLRSGNVQDKLVFDDLIYVPEDFVRTPGQYIQQSDVVVSVSNSRELVGKCAGVMETAPKIVIGGFLAIVRPANEIRGDFLLLLLRSTRARKHWLDSASQTTNIANISSSAIKNLEVDLPPIEEQERIAAQVKSLMTICEELVFSYGVERDLAQALGESVASALRT